MSMCIDYLSHRRLQKIYVLLYGFSKNEFTPLQWVLGGLVAEAQGMTHASKVDPDREIQAGQPRGSWESQFWLRGKASYGQVVLQWSRFPGWSLLFSVFYLVQKISCPSPSQRREGCCSLCCVAWPLPCKIGLDEDLFSITEQPRLGSVGLISMRNKALWVSGSSLGARVPLFCIHSYVACICRYGEGLGFVQTSHIP